MSLLTKPQIIVKNGKRAVVLDMEDYRRLVNLAEEKEDVAEIKRTKKTGRILETLSIT